ncbi:MAG: PEP-CTERM sorting domain-containing protein [Pirellulales bacterium]
MRLMYIRAALAASLAMGWAVPAATAAPLGYTGGTITENFNTLPTDATNPTQLGLPKTAFDLNPAINNVTGLTGWQGNNVLGSSATTDFHSQDGSSGSSAGRGINSLGTNGSTERALGAIPTSNNINQFGLALTNNSSDTYGSFSLSYTGEQWRRGEAGVTNTMTFAWGLAANIDASLTDVGALSFANPNNQAAPTQVAIDGNDPLNQVGVAGVVNSINWAPGQTLVLRWTMSEGSGQDNGLAIDDLSFSATPVPEPSSMALFAVALVGLGGYVTRRRGRRS